MLCRLLIVWLFVLGSATAGEARAAPAVALREVTVSANGRSLRISLLVFSARDFSLRVIDNADPAGKPRFTTLADAMKALGGIAGCNGGFFNRRPFEPVGGMISENQRISAVDPVNWMKGMLVVRGGQPALESTESFQESPDITELVQSGPWLVRAGRAESDNSRKQVAVRTFICRDAGGVWALGATGSCTLSELAAVLRSPEVSAVLDIESALNLDGGPSTGLWLRRDSGDFHLRERWPVRNYLGIFPKSSP